jgi:hypothetical protein
MSTFSRIAVSVLGVPAAVYFSGCVVETPNGEQTGEIAAAETTCRRVPIPATDSSDCLDTPPACSLASWSEAAGCSIVVDPSCICFQGQTRSCVAGDTGFPKQICSPGSATCGVQFCQLIAGVWKWETTCHTL